jgi:hypothetical protein
MLATLGLATAADGRVATLALVFWAVSIGWSLVGGLVWLVAGGTGAPAVSEK